MQPPTQKGINLCYSWQKPWAQCREKIFELMNTGKKMTMLS